MPVTPYPATQVPSDDEVRVLVVEDHDATRYSHCRLLQHRGYRVAEAATARDALSAAESFQPHCVLLDLGLPDMGGLEVARHLRKHMGPELVMIAVTGIADPALLESAEVNGVDFLMRKPLDIDKLAKMPPVIGL